MLRSSDWSSQDAQRRYQESPISSGNADGSGWDRLRWSEYSCVAGQNFDVRH
jgi:hypothetical protein